MTLFSLTFSLIGSSGAGRRVSGAGKKKKQSLTTFTHTLSIADTYSVGKAAMNMVVRKYGGALKVQGSDIILLNVYPGM